MKRGGEEQRRFVLLEKGRNHIYLDGESLLLYHPESGHVYGFEKESAALVLQLNDLLQAGDKAPEEAFPHLPKSFLEDVKNLLAGNVPRDTEGYEPPLQTGEFVKDPEGRESFCAEDRLAFHIRFPDKAFREKIFPQFEPLRTGNPERCRLQINIDIKKSGERWQLMFNNLPIALPVKRETIPLVLQENLIIAYYQASPYLMAMHAGAVSVLGKRVVFPGKSGSGKSTLTASLTAAGHLLYSDEIALLGYDGTLNALPFAMNIKEGSWSVLAEGFRELRDRPVHVRFDGQRVKFLKALQPADRPGPIDVVVFPKFEEGTPCRLEPLSACETLRRIKEAGYQLEQPLDEEHFEAILKHLLSKPSFALTYGNLDDAVTMIEECVVG